MSRISYPPDVRDYLDIQRTFTIHRTKGANGDTIARATVNGHAFEARHPSEQRATRLLTEMVDQAEESGAILEPPKPS